MVFKAQDLILNFDRIRSDITDFTRGNPLIAAGVALGTPLSLVGIASIGRSVGRRVATRRKKRKVTTTRKRKSGKRRKTTTKRRTRKVGRPKGKRRKFGLRKAVRSKKILTTKNGQPYIILANGRARFIRKSSARSARKRKGGFR